MSGAEDTRRGVGVLGDAAGAQDAQDAQDVEAVEDTEGAEDVEDVEAAREAADAALTRAAYEALAEALAQTPERRVRGVALKTAAVRGLRLWRAVQAEDVAARLKLLPEALFAPDAVDKLRAVSLAASHVDGMLRDAKTLEAGEATKLPKALVEEATALRAEMLEVAAYVLGRDAKVSALLADIRKGKGYQDLASDLDRLSRLYEQRAEALAKDQVRYKPEDATRAARLDADIINALDQDRRERVAHWSAQAAKLTSLLHTTSNEVLDAARFVMRLDPTRDRRFRSLFT